MHSTLSRSSGKISPDIKTYDETFCFDGQNDWDDGIFMLLFAVKEVFHESLDFSPFELVLDTLWEVLFDRKMVL
jgi:hypothetical protein